MVIRPRLIECAKTEDSIPKQATTSTQTVPFGGLNYATALAAGYFDFSGFGVLDSTPGTPLPAHIYDPSTGNPAGVGRTAFPLDRIPLSRVDPAAKIMASLIPAANQAGTTNNYLEALRGTFARDNVDAKINYVPSEKTNYFGHFSMSRATFFDPPALGPAGGSATDGGQQGNSTPHIYVIGLGFTHAFTPNLLLDANAGYTRQHLLSTNVDIGSPFGLNTLKIPGTNDAGIPGGNPLYWGQPAFSFNNFSSLGNTASSNPLEMRDNQLLGSVNLTWVKGSHQFRAGFEDDHTGINHFQPQGNATPRGSFGFTGAAGALLFLRGDVEKAHSTSERSYSQQQVFDSMLLPPADRPYFTTGYPLYVPLQHKVRISSLAGPPTQPFDASETPNPIVSDTRQLAWCTSPKQTGLVTVDTARSQALIGFVKAQGKVVSNLAADISNNFCAILLSSLEPKPIATSSELLLVTAGPIENTGESWNSAGTDVTNWGGTPTLVEPVKGTITLRGIQGAHTVSVQAIDGAG